MASATRRVCGAAALALALAGCGVLDRAPAPSSSVDALLERRGGVVLVLAASPGPTGTVTDEDLRRAAEVLRARIDRFRLMDAEVALRGTGAGATFTVTLPGVLDEEAARALARPGTVDLRPVADVVLAAEPSRGTATPPAQADGDAALRAALTSADCSSPSGRAPGTPQDPTRWLVACSAEEPLVYLLEPAVIRGADVADARVVESAGTAPVVEVVLDARGAQALAEVSARLAPRASPGNQLALVVDSAVVSAPYLREAILNGTFVVDGSFTADQARELATTFSSGGLPVRLEVVELRLQQPR